MKKIYVFEVTQHSMKRYIGKAAAKDLVRLATTAELSAVQEAQRPISPKRLEEISQFVQKKDGILSTSVVIGTKNDLLTVHPESTGNIPGLFYIEFPETDDEFERYKNSFDIMDGQHRLFSFLPDYIKIADDEAFEITFEMYLNPTLDDRRLIFKNTNEKQEKVAPNLLMWFREKLDMLSDKEQKYHGVVSLLNRESCSPLKGRIIMGAEKITGGFKAQQLIKIFDKSDIKQIGGRASLDDQAMLHLISNYLIGWERAVGTKLSDRDTQFGPFSKIAGFRFMILMLPAFYEQAVTERAKFEKEYVTNKINTLFSQNGIEARDLFDKTSDYFKNLGNPFSAETPTTRLAKDWSNKLKNLTSGDFDPLG